MQVIRNCHTGDGTHDRRAYTRVFIYHTDVFPIEIPSLVTQGKKTITTTTEAAAAKNHKNLKSKEQFFNLLWEYVIAAFILKNQRKSALNVNEVNGDRHSEKERDELY